MPIKLLLFVVNLVSKTHIFAKLILKINSK